MAKPARATLITQEKVADLKPYDKNTKIHGPKQIADLANAIGTYGFNVPLILNAKKEVIAGHGRLEDVKFLGWDTVPCVIVSHLSPTQVKAMRIADNKLAESPWDYGNLALEFAELEALPDFDAASLGFEQFEFDAILGKVGDFEDPLALGSRPPPELDDSDIPDPEEPHYQPTGDVPPGLTGQSGYKAATLLYTEGEHAEFVELVGEAKRLYQTDQNTAAVLFALREVVAKRQLNKYS